MGRPARMEKGVVVGLIDSKGYEPKELNKKQTRRGRRSAAAEEERAAKRISVGSDNALSQKSEEEASSSKDRESGNLGRDGNAHPGT